MTPYFEKGPSVGRLESYNLRVRIFLIKEHGRSYPVSITGPVNPNTPRCKTQYSHTNTQHTEPDPWNYHAFIGGEIKALYKYANIFTVCK